MNKHTKGPWAWVGDRLEAPGEDVLGVDDDGKEFGMHSAILVESEDYERAAANRSLIAAAPELLESLKAMVEAWNMVCDANGWERDHIQQQKDAVSAIGKATGEKP